MPTTIDAKGIKQALESSYKVRSYSGRGMFGKYCVGINYDRVSDVAAIAIMLASVFGFDATLKVTDQALTESMYPGSILYFPTIKWEDVDEADFLESTWK